MWSYKRLLLIFLCLSLFLYTKSHPLGGSPILKRPFLTKKSLFEVERCSLSSRAAPPTMAADIQPDFRLLQAQTTPLFSIHPLGVTGSGIQSNKMLLFVRPAQMRQMRRHRNSRHHQTQRMTPIRVLQVIQRQRKISLRRSLHHPLQRPFENWQLAISTDSRSMISRFAMQKRLQL